MLLQVGTTLGLAAPLIVLTRMIEERVRRTEKRVADVSAQVRETQDRLDNIGEVTREGLLNRQHRRLALLREASRTPTAERLEVLLRELTAINSIDAGGVRVRLPGTTRWLRFTTTGSDGGVRVVREQRDGKPVVTVDWPDGGAIGVVARGLECPDAQFEAACRVLVDTLAAALSAEVGETELKLGRVIEVPNEQWVISSDGLRCTQRYVHISVDQLLDSHQDWRSHMLTKPWVNHEMFKDAYRTASELLAARRRSD
ncbi:hypothetical protein [Amycolatopsis sp. NPDC051102]|uniref:hypothetical protein n=1 Tax=Amycolatopsis sp. NPDC051102 TaxID=3155163 RepID=UPI003412FD15